MSSIFCSDITVLFNDSQNAKVLHNSPRTALARRYRPQTLQDLKGQESLVIALKKAIDKGTLAQAIVLSGIRGTGKTTTARIIAKGLNCALGPTTTPCGVCDACTSIHQDRHLDVVEMDAASHTGVDDVRALIETAKYKPVQSRYKIYILDEVHMLSKSAFNALLKTLEEPPPHVIFIFATTEIKKIPDTILSRCMRFDLMRMDMETLKTHVMHISAQEKLSVSHDAAILIARAALGSMRDALSLLDQAALMTHQVIDAQAVRHMLGLTSKEGLYSVLSAIFSKNIQKILDVTEDYFQRGSDPLSMLQELLDMMYRMLCLKSHPSMASSMHLTEEETAFFSQNQTSVPTLLHVWQVLSDRFDKISKAPQPFQAFQILLMQACYVAELPPLGEILDELSQGHHQGFALPQPSPQMSSKAHIKGHQVLPHAEEGPQNITSPAQPSRSASPVKAAWAPPQEAPLQHDAHNKSDNGDQGEPYAWSVLAEAARDSGHIILYGHMYADMEVCVLTVDGVRGALSFYKSAHVPHNIVTLLKQFFTLYAPKITWDIKDLGVKDDLHSLMKNKREAQKNSAKMAQNHPVVQDLQKAFPGAKVLLNAKTDDGTS